MHWGRVEREPSQTCRQPLSQNSRMSHAVLSSERVLPLRLEPLLALGDPCCPASECTLSCTILQDTTILSEINHKYTLDAH